MLIDIWSDDDDLEAIAASVRGANPLPEEKVKTPQGKGILPPLEISEGKHATIALQDGDEPRIRIASRSDLLLIDEFKELRGCSYSTSQGQWNFSMPLRPLNAFALRYALHGIKVDIAPEVGQVLSREASKVPMPRGVISKDGKKLEFVVPGLDSYRSIMRKMDAFPVADGGAWRANISRAMDVELLCSMGLKHFPPIHLDEEITKLTTEPIPGFDGTLDSLKEISIGELNIVKANAQNYKQRKKSEKSMKEKLETFGISTLYDLLIHMPRRYIDKSNPQEIRNLVIDEPATIVGTITAVTSMPNNMGVRFTVETAKGRSIETTFWRQSWLSNKFPVGSEVIVTGKFNIWNHQPQLNGSSIEHSEEAVLLPIMPIYKQSESKGITTGFLVSAVREFFSRVGEIRLPEYLEKEGRVGYHEAYQELHLPSDLAHHRKVIDTLAYYELVNMQLIIQDERANTALKPGVVQEAGESKLQEKAIASLPFTLTQGQQDAVAKMNAKLAGDTPSSTLVNAEVGSGKTIIAQLACLRSVESGHQAVLLGPTDVLARQLHATFERLITPLNDAGDNIRLAYLGGAMKAAEKKKVLKALEAGEIDILVGTHALFSTATKYHNLGLVCVDEQQKFGAENRSALLSIREDGKVPDLLMQSATPIPRSTAQVFYGDIDMILLTDKPKGRLPIETEWVEENPNDIIDQLIHPMWSDLASEAEKGNQSFIITPLVRDSENIDAASVERTHKAISTGVLRDLSVGIVHGKMKADEQRQVMEDFRAKKYDAIVASTIVEVGVDIPDATRVVVLSAERLGASSLHQIRGRAGRNSKPSKCYLVSLGETDSAQHRLQSLVDYPNGFDVAKSDLTLRGEGQIFGSNQSGASEMIYASLSAHGNLIPEAKAEALEVLSGPWRDEALNRARESFDVQGRFK